MKTLMKVALLLIPPHELKKHEKEEEKDLGRETKWRFGGGAAGGAAGGSIGYAVAGDKGMYIGTPIGVAAGYALGRMRDKKNIDDMINKQPQMVSHYERQRRHGTIGSKGLLKKRLHEHSKGLRGMNDDDLSGEDSKRTKDVLDRVLKKRQDFANRMEKAYGWEG
jgi:uncharacterized protein YcfJ